MNVERNLLNTMSRVYAQCDNDIKYNRTFYFKHIQNITFLLILHMPITYSIFKYLKSFYEVGNQNLERANDQERKIKLIKRF